MAITCSLGCSFNECKHTTFHPTPLHIEVLIPSFKIIMLKNRMAVSPNHVKALQMTLLCGLNPPDTNREHNEQI